MAAPPSYRQVMAEIYEEAQVPREADTFQAALRYHVGNLLRERADESELAAVGLTSRPRRTRLATQP